MRQASSGMHQQFLHCFVHCLSFSHISLSAAASLVASLKRKLLRSNWWMLPVRLLTPANRLRFLGCSLSLLMTTTWSTGEDGSVTEEPMGDVGNLGMLDAFDVATDGDEWTREPGAL